MERVIFISCLVILLVVICIGCLCLIYGAGFSYLIFNSDSTDPYPLPTSITEVTTTSGVIRPTAQETPVPTITPTYATEEATPTIVPSPTPTATPVVVDVPEDTLELLETVIVPINDLLDLSARLQGKRDIPVTLEPPSAPFQVGARQRFWATNVDTDESFQVQAVLRYVTPHLYFWIEEGVSFDMDELRSLCDQFEDTIYPTNREFFGSEWTPGIDGDIHLYILYAGGLGSFLAGYYSSSDEYSPQAHEYSNGHEMFFINSDNQDLGSEETYGTLTHEFQHMIHWYRDRNEDTWMNEGFSVLSEFLNDYMVYFDYEYVADPDLQLTDWSPEMSANGPHYGMSFLFMDYFLDRFGEDATKALVAEPENGLVSIDKVLKDLNITDGFSGEIIGADDVFMDWVVASYLQDKTIADGRYTYHNYPRAPRPDETERLFDCLPNQEVRQVHQYGVDYIRISCQGDYTLHFEGSTMVKVVPEDPHSGSYAFWSNKGDESDMTLTRTFDFANLSGPITLSYWTWYDLEQDYDYLYLEASLNGQNWQIITTPSGTPDDPSGNSYGWAYNGLSGGDDNARWIQEEVDLSQYAGQTVQLRFEYVTDAAVNGEGFLLDDISISEIGYSTNFEQDDGGWEAQGFVRIQNILPQKYGISLITQGDTTTVERISLNPDNTVDIPLHIGGNVEDVILVVSGLTRFTRIEAAYQFSFLP